MNNFNLAAPLGLPSNLFHSSWDFFFTRVWLADICVPFPSALFLFPNFVYICIYDLLSGVKKDG